MVQNKSIVLKSIPDGWPVPGKDLVVEKREFNPDQAPPRGGITAKNLYASFDPYQRGRMRDPSIKSYAPAYHVGEPISNSVVSKVLKSDNAQFKPGDLVVGMWGIEEYSVVTEDDFKAAMFPIQKIDNKYNLDPALFLGPLGMPGLTAYSSFYDIGQPKKGETIFISAASGAVG